MSVEDLWREGAEMERNGLKEKLRIVTKARNDLIDELTKTQIALEDAFALLHDDLVSAIKKRHGM